MMHTKQTAKKLTGGVAKRKSITPSTRVLCSQTPRSQELHSPQPASDSKMAEADELFAQAAGSGQVTSNFGAVSAGSCDKVSCYCRLFKSPPLTMPSFSPQPTPDVQMARTVEPLASAAELGHVASSADAVSADNTDEVSGHYRSFKSPLLTIMPVVPPLLRWE